MGIISGLRKVERKLPVGLIGTLGTVAGLLIGYWAGFGFERKPHLSYSVLADANVFALEHVIGELDIIRNGKSIKADERSLRVLTVRVVNDGEVDITKNLYDEGDPLGFRLSTGIIVEVPQLLDTNSDYIKRNFHGALGNSGTVVFPAMIIDRGTYFVVKVLVLHDSQNKPTVTPVGKIAGINELAVVDQHVRPSMISQVMDASLGVHLARAVSYIVVIVVCVSSAIGAVRLIEHILHRRRVRQRAAPFFDKEFIGPLARLYYKRGDLTLDVVYFIVNSSQTRVLPIKDMDLTVYTDDRYDTMKTRILEEIEQHRRHLDCFPAVWDALRWRWYLTVQEDKLVIAKEFVDEFQEFTEAVAPRWVERFRGEPDEKELARIEAWLKRNERERREAREEVRKLRSKLGISSKRRLKAATEPASAITIPETDGEPNGENTPE